MYRRREFNLFAIRRNSNAIYTYVRLAYVVSGIRAAYIYDPRINQAIAQLPDGSEILISAYPSNYYIYAIKTNKGLICRVRRDATISTNGANVTFKSFEALLPVMQNVLSFKDAFNQNRCIIQGNIALGMKIVKILDMAQATLTTERKRRKFLHEKPYSKNVEFKVKMTAWAKGWR